MGNSRPPRRVDAALGHDQVRLEGIIDSAMDAIISIDEEQRIVVYNRAAASVFGVPIEEAIGSPLERFIPARFRAQHRNHVRLFGETGITTRRMGARTVLFGLRANGDEFPMDASISQVVVGGHKLFTVILRDISERVRAEEQIERTHRELGDLSRAANQALEDQRRRIARELHDELGQVLSAMKLDLTQMHGHLPPENIALRARITELGALLDQTIMATRRLSAELRPLILDDLGVGAAAEWLVENFVKRTGIQVQLTFEESLAGVGEPQASAIFRIMQESLTNVMRHACATQVSIDVARADGFATVRVKDNGRGIAPEDLTKPGSYGVLGMRERARLIGGELQVERTPDGGTVIAARIPLGSV